MPDSWTPAPRLLRRRRRRASRRCAGPSPIAGRTTAAPMSRRPPGWARPPAPVDHRPLPARPPADDLGRQPIRHHLQRRGLQFPRAARRARSARPSLSRRLRHRGDARRLRRLGRRESGDALRRHVRHRPLGPADAHASTSSATASASSRSTGASIAAWCCSVPSSRR